MSFKFKGVIPVSKSIMNRALICSSYELNLQLEGTSSCDDIVKMQESIAQLKENLSYSKIGSNNKPTEYDCGAAGTVLRFLTLRLSRIPGKHILKGTERLMQRPQQDLLDLLQKLDVSYEIGKTQIQLESNGWKNTDKPIKVHREVSSQFASGIILNAWNLENDLVLDMVGASTSEGYLEMTLQVVKTLGMEWTYDQKQIVIPKHSKIKTHNYQVESDISSLFAVAAFSALNGPAEFLNYPWPSLQPDSEFLQFFKQMEIEFIHSDAKKSLLVMPTKKFKGLNANINSCPDLFPVLATLCAFAETPSKLYGAPQLVHKESNRIAKVAELLNAIGVKNEPLPDGMIIHPFTGAKESVKEFSYDTDHDHRLAFASAIIQSQGFPIHVHGPDVVSKSFPEFWQVIGLNPK